MGQEHFWQVRPDDVASRRIDKMAAAIAWVRQDEDRYAVFGDTARADRYVQFAYGGGGTSAEATEATRVALPLLLAVAGSGRSDRGFTPDDVNSFTEVGPRLSTPYAGEPDHEPLLMEVGSGDWPKSSRQGLADEAGSESRSRSRALEALPPDGSVLDIGCGGGRASLALVPFPGAVVGVDESADMLAAFAEAAEARGIAHDEVLGRWPDVADTVEAADVAVCHHVAYNVPDLGAFATALTNRARRRVVLELTELHPLVATAPLWKHFHGLDRPSGRRADRQSTARLHPVTSPSPARPPPCV